ncbi:MAG: RNA polymerase sigma-70 factor [Chitinophaga rupis]
MQDKERPNTRDRDPELEVHFIRIFREHEYKLYTLALRLTKSDLYAKDIIQEVFLSLWDHRSNIAGIHNMEAWLYRVTENKILDFLRKAAVNSRLKNAVWANLQDSLTNETINLVEAKECESIIRKAVDSLPPQRQLIYRLNRDKGMSYQEIADELSVSRHTVKNQVFSALESIRKFITRHRLLFWVIGYLFFVRIGRASSCFVLFNGETFLLS